MINVNWSTLLLQIANFVVMVFILTRFFFRPVMRALDERSKRVSSALEEAEQREQEASKLHAEYEEKLTEAQEQALIITQRAQDELEQTRRRLLAEAREEILHMQTKAERELDEARHQAVVEHRQELGRLATTLSARLMGQAGGAEFQQASVQEFIERLSTLPAEEYRRALEGSQTEVVQVQMISAIDLENGNRSQFEKKIKEVLDRPIDVRYQVDPSLIAGATVRFGDTVVDGSLAGQLQTLSERYLESVEQGTL